MSTDKHPAAAELEKYISEVYGGNIDLTHIPFPKKEGFPAYMVRPDGLDADLVLAQLIKHFTVGKRTHRSPVAKHINCKVEQKRPKSTYVAACVGGDKPDARHLGKSYNDSVTEKMVFASCLDYLLMTGNHFWKHEKWMDMTGLTSTSSRWSDGGVVFGGWFPGVSELFLLRVDRGLRGQVGGPRELFLG